MLIISQTQRDHQSYDQHKRRRLYRAEWEHQYPRLEYDKEKDVMACKVCRQIYTATNPFEDLSTDLDCSSSSSSSSSSTSSYSDAELNLLD